MHLHTNHYRLFLILSVAGIFTITCYNNALAQTPTNGDYRSKASASWENVSTWQVRSGGVWINATSLPTTTSNVYIQNGHQVSTGGPDYAKDIHINSGGRLALGGTLNIYGKLRCYTGTVVTSTADGVFYSSQSSTTNVTSTNLYRTMAAAVYFKGTTRNVTNTGEWGPAGKIGVGLNFDLNAGNTATLQAAIYTDGINVITGTLNVGTNTIFLGAGAGGNGVLSIQVNGTVISANSGTSNTNCIINEPSTGNPPYLLNIYGKLVLTGATPYIRIENLNMFPGSTIEYGGSTQNFMMSSYPSLTAVNTYRNLILSGTGNKTPQSNFDVNENITISGSATLLMGSRTANITGNWTSYGQAGFSEGTSTVNFDSTGAQSINTTGGENFYILRKSNSGTLTLNSAVNIVAGGNLNMQAGVIDANANTFSGTATSAFNMSGGTIKLAKLNTTLPEFLVSSYNITGGTIELDGAGTQTLRGARDYRNLSFSNSGTKGITSAINNITGTVTVSGSVILDVLNNTMGGTGTNLTMTGTSTYRTAGASQVKPDAAGTYSLGSATTIEFNNNLSGLESIRLIGSATVNYAKVIVSGTSVGTASLATGIRFQSGGSFTVKSGAVFKQINTTGFSGASTTAVSSTNNPTIILEAGSTVEYNGDNQAISNQTINTPSTANYENLLLSGTGNKTAPSGTLSIKGDLTKTGTTGFIHNSGTVVMNGTAAQDYNSSFPFMKFYNFSNNNTVDLSVYSEMSIVAEMSFGSGSKLNLQSGSNIILVSNSSGTANVGVIPSNAAINYFSNGRFTVERYIPTGISHGKSWQFLAVPTNGGQTVNQAWQDTATAANQSRYGGYGTMITSNISPLPLRFDAFTSPGPSMKTYDTAGNSWNGIPNTTTLPIYNTKGYMVFVRGDRTVITSNGTANETILRTSGRIFSPLSNVGSTPPVIPVSGNRFESIGNPYASAIDFSDDAGVIKSGSIQKVFYVWDPKLGGSYGFGGYQAFTRGAGADNNYYVTPGGGSYGVAGSVNNHIQSGQAFFVRAFGSDGTVSFSETAKVSGSNITFKPAPQHLVSVQLRITLSAVEGTGMVPVDGVLTESGKDFSNDIDELDVLKLQNTTENMSISSHNSNLMVERRKLFNEHDTIYLSLTQLRIQEYILNFLPRNFNSLVLDAYLEDTYLQERTLLPPDNISSIGFTVSSDPGSYAINRFRIVFRKRIKCIAEQESQLLYSFSNGTTVKKHNLIH